MSEIAQRGKSYKDRKYDIQGCSGTGTRGNSILTPFSCFTLKWVGSCFKLAIFLDALPHLFCQHYIPDNIRKGAKAIRVFHWLSSLARSFRRAKHYKINSDHKYLLYHTEVRRMSRDNVGARVFELRDELSRSSITWTRSSFSKMLVYLSSGIFGGYFEALNQLNLMM